MDIHNIVHNIRFVLITFTNHLYLEIFIDKIIFKFSKIQT